MIWRKIKKIYFKIYHLFKLIGIFIIVMIPTIIKADEYNNIFDQYKIGNLSIENNNYLNHYILLPKIDIENKNTIYVRFFANTNLECTCNSCFYRYGFITTTTSNSNVNNNNYKAKCKTFDNENQIMEIEIPTVLDNGKWTQIIIVPNVYNNNGLGNTPLIASVNKEDLIASNTGGTAIEEFTTIYTDKLSYLGTETMNNEYMLAFIGIIIGFIVLEIFLRIFHIRGGYKK